MVTLLLLLLLQESLADQVCIDISDFKINFTINEGSVLDYKNSDVKCETDSFPCLLTCTPSNETWFNESSVSSCLEASVWDEAPGVTVYALTYSTCYRYICNRSAILPLIKDLECTSCGAEEIMKLFYIRKSCPELLYTDFEIKKYFLKVEKQIIHNIIKMSTFEGGNVASRSLRDLSIKVVKIDDDAFSSTGSVTIEMEAPQLLPQNESVIPEVWLPVNAIRNIPQEERIVGLVSYMQHRHLLFDGENIQSIVLRIELLGERRLQNLKPPIKMRFSAAHMDNGNQTQLTCHYFDEYEWAWKKDGCETQNEQNDIVCNCNHTTAFAVLLIRAPISEAHWKILSYISYIGCGLSAFFSALSIIMYVYTRNHKMDYSIAIHTSLSGALLLLNTAFLLSEWAATVTPEWVCECVAALMHYSLLCCFTWMAIEALHLYLLLIKVFNTYYKYYLLKLSIAGWGIPGLIVATSLGMKDFKQFYGVNQVSMSDSNQTAQICWITDDAFFYSVNLSYFAIIFIFNSGILMAVASSICRMKHVLKNYSKFKNGNGHPNRFGASCKSGLTLLGLTCLMGTTWGLAFLGSGYVNYPILYLFCILNSLQGFLIFLWILISTKKQRKLKMEEKLSSTPGRTSATKSE